MKKFMIIPFTLFLLASCGFSSQYSSTIQAEQPGPNDQLVTSEEEMKSLESQGYLCHRQIRSQKSENCHQTSVGEVCGSPKVSYGDWICRKPENNNLNEEVSIPQVDKEKANE